MEIKVQCPICKCDMLCEIIGDKMLNEVEYSDKCEVCGGTMNFTINASAQPFCIDKSIKILQNKISANEKELDALYKAYAPEIETEPLFRKTQFLKNKLIDWLISRDYQIKSCISLDDNIGRKKSWLIEKKHKEVTTFIGYTFESYDEAHLWLKKYIKNEILEASA